MSSRRPLLLMAAGGTGGHLFPAQALAEAMLARGWRVRLSTDARGARYVGGFDPAVEIVEVSSATPARGGRLARALAPLRIAAGLAASAVTMLRDRPDVVVGFGGYPSIPALGAAFALRRPRMIHEQNGVLGRVNRVFAARVHHVACGVWPTELPAGVAASHVGNPVRQAIRDRAGAPYAAPGDGPVHLLAFGGSQGARVISEAVPAAIARLDAGLRARLRVAHQARDADHADVTAAYRDAGVAAEVAPFFEDIPRRLTEAQLVVCRAGASSVADIAAIGRPSILVPLAAALRDEQTANARALVEADAAILMTESRLAADTLSAEIASVLEAPERAARMAANAAQLGRPDATERLVALVEEVARTRGRVAGKLTAVGQKNGGSTEGQDKERRA